MNLLGLLNLREDRIGERPAATFCELHPKILDEKKSMRMRNRSKTIACWRVPDLVGKLPDIR